MLFDLPQLSVCEGALWARVLAPSHATAGVAFTLTVQVNLDGLKHVLFFNVQYTRHNRLLILDGLKHVLFFNVQYTRHNRLLISDGLKHVLFFNSNTQDTTDF